MTGADVLLAIAEAAVALAGFASVVVLFQHRDPTHWPPFVVVRLRSMIELGFATLFFALAPFAPHHLGASAQTTWAGCSALLAVGGAVLFAVVYRRSRPFLGRGLSPGFSGVVGLVTAIVLGLQVLNVFGWIVARGFGAYLVGVLWLLAFAALMFLRLVAFPDPGARQE